MKKSLVLILLFITGVLVASVPNRITYQGRLSKNSSPVIGSHTFGVRIYPAATPAASLWQDLNIPVTLGPEGEFTIVLEIGDIDWINTDPRLEITVDGEKLSPADSFETTPYSFVAKRVDAGGVNTAALADGAVTNAKVAVGVAASKILVTTNTYLSDWRHPTQLDKIDAAKIFPSLAVDSIVTSSPSVAQFIQASQPVTPLTIKGKSGVLGTIPVFDVRDNSDELRFRVRGAGEQFLSGPVGVGTEAPGAPLDIVSSSASVVLRNTQAPEASRTWQVAVNNLGKMNIQATNAALGSPVSALALSRDGSVDMPTARISSSTIQNLNSTNLVTQNFTATTLGMGTVTAGSVTAGTMTVTGPSTLSGSLTVSGTTTLGTLTVSSMSSTNVNFSNINATNVLSTNVNASSVTATNISASNITATNGLVGQWLAAPYPMIIVEDSKPSGNDGGASSVGSWQTRTLNTVSTNTIVGASLASNSVTLPSGTYRISWRAPAVNVGIHKSAWRNTTDNVFAVLGGNGSNDNVSDTTTNSLGTGVFSITSPKVFQLWHRFSSSKPDGLGVAAGFGVNEVYSQVIIEKIR